VATQQCINPPCRIPPARSEAERAIRCELFALLVGLGLPVDGPTVAAVAARLANGARPRPTAERRAAA
jgi:hypothetical protein